MSSENDLREATAQYEQLLPSLLRLEQQRDEWKTKFEKEFKPVCKKIAKQKRVFKKYMKQHGISEMTVAGTTFTFEVEPKIKCTIDLVEKSFPPDAVARFKQENSKTRNCFEKIVSRA